jgi:phosphate transport system permease protein
MSSDHPRSASLFGGDEQEYDSHFKRNARGRHGRSKAGRRIFATSTLIALIALGALLYNVVVESFGLVAVEYEIEPAALSDRPLEELSREELLAILEQHLSRGVFRRYDREQSFEQRSRENLYQLVQERVVEERPIASWPLNEALLNRSAIEQEVVETYPGARLQWKSWLSVDFIKTAMSSDPTVAGVRTALLGSLYMIGITILTAFPVGVGAAIYLEEYASDSPVNRLIQTNIANLAGVPSIIYGMLGLAIFVRTLEPLTSGALFGVSGVNGRTVLSAALTLALLILPIIIISSQEAIRAVPRSLRLASYGLGATKWQTIWHHVLPGALPGILTGSILAMSRAIGETAPLIVVGASTFIVTDPTSPFAKFTALPIQIYQWTARPQDMFRDIAAAAILVLLVLLLTLNAVAILLRNRFSARR